MKAAKTLFLTVCLASARVFAADSVWSTSIDNGCKPGIGFRITQATRGITGSAYVLDPSHAHDFSRGIKRKMDVTDSKPTEVRFKLDWGDGKQRSYVLQFAAPLDSKPVKGTLREEPANGLPTEFTFKRTKSK